MTTERPSAVAVNTHEGQVAIPLAGSHVVGRLGARAMRWVEEVTGRTIDEIYTDFARRAARAMRAQGTAQVAPTSASFPVNVAVTVIWAAVEHERRLQGLPGPEFTLDEADQVVEEHGLDDTYSIALALIQLSTPFRKRTEEIDRAAQEAGHESPLAELRRVAAGGTGPGTGTPTSAPASPPGSEWVKPGS